MKLNSPDHENVNFIQFRPKLWKFVISQNNLCSEIQLYLANNKLSQFWSKLAMIHVFVIRRVEFHNTESISRSNNQNLLVIRLTENSIDPCHFMCRQVLIGSKKFLQPIKNCRVTTKNTYQSNQIALIITNAWVRSSQM